MPTLTPLDDFVFQNVLASPSRGGVVLEDSRWGGQFRLETAPAPHHRAVAVVGQPPRPGVPHYVVGPHGILRVHSPGETLFIPWILCPSTQTRMHRCMQAQAQQLLRETNERQREIAGLLVCTAAGDVELRRFAGPSEHLSVDPYCGGQREETHGVPPELGASEVLLGEFHTHPTLHGLLAPPSNADLFQLALAAYKGQHNCSYIVAAEGIYWCRINPDRCRTIMEDVRTFLARYGMDEREAQEVIEACEQPVVAKASVLRQDIPRLWMLLDQPKQAYRDLTRHNATTGKGKRQQDAGRTPAREDAESFCRSMERVGLVIRLLPPLRS